MQLLHLSKEKSRDISWIYKKMSYNNHSLYSHIRLVLISRVELLRVEPTRKLLKEYIWVIFNFLKAFFSHQWQKQMKIKSLVILSLFQLSPLRETHKEISFLKSNWLIISCFQLQSSKWNAKNIFKKYFFLKKLSKSIRLNCLNYDD